MGDLRNCPLCGKVFVRINKNICPDCVEKEEQQFEEVRKYVKEHPGASVTEIAETLEVDENRILKWIREGRLDANTVYGTGLTCGRCGAVISSGNLCTKCAKALAEQINSVSGSARQKLQEESKKPKENENRGMFLIDRFRDE